MLMTRIFTLLSMPKPEDVNRAVQITENCLTDLRTWFAQNILQLNDDKTIFLLIGSKCKLLPDIPYIQVGEVEITPFATATNLGDQRTICS